MDKAQIYQAVQDRYTTATRAPDAEYSRTVAMSFGYTEEELASIPKDANLGLSCGNPIALASLKEGETVIDLGSGAGFDVFLAANKVGPGGRVYGVDRNKDMLARAEKAKTESGNESVFFVESNITDIALDSGIADCIISNCVINLVPEEEKQMVFTELFRLLKPGGRVAVSDILLRKALPEHLRTSVALYTGCIAGASQLVDYERYLKVAGFQKVVIADTNADLNIYLEAETAATKAAKGPPGNDNGSRAAKQCCGTLATDETADSCQKGQCCPDIVSQCGGCGSRGDAALEEARAKLAGQDLNEWAGSFKIFAVKS